MECVIFDMDGVIFSTEKIWKQGFCKINKRFGIKLSEKQRQMFCGVNYDGQRRCLTELGLDIDIDKYLETLHSHVENRILTEGVKFNRGFKELIEFLKSKNIKIGLATGSPRHLIHGLFEKNNMDEQEIFDTIITGNEVKEGKPDPESYSTVCQRLNVNPKETYVIEDSENGITAALKADCNVIIKLDLITPSEELKNQCKYCTKSLKKIKKYLENYIK